MKIDRELLDYFDDSFLVVLLTFAVCVPLDWFFNHPSEAHWRNVGLAFLVFVMVQIARVRVKRTDDKLNEIDGKLDTILKKLNESR